MSFLIVTQASSRCCSQSHSDCLSARCPSGSQTLLTFGRNLARCVSRTSRYCTLCALIACHWLTFFRLSLRWRSRDRFRSALEARSCESISLFIIVAVSITAISSAITLIHSRHSRHSSRRLGKSPGANYIPKGILSLLHQSKGAQNMVQKLDGWSNATWRKPSLTSISEKTLALIKPGASSSIGGIKWCLCLMPLVRSNGSMQILISLGFRTTTMLNIQVVGSVTLANTSCCSI